MSIFPPSDFSKMSILCCVFLFIINWNTNCYKWKNAFLQRTSTKTILCKKGKLKSSIIIDELPTIYFKGLDNLIATARSNKVAVLLGFQDFSQLVRDYGDKEAKVVMNTVGNIFSGQVVGETAKTLSERFGKVLQKRQSITINRNDKSTSINTQMDYRLQCFFASCNVLLQ